MVLSAVAWGEEKEEVFLDSQQLLLDQKEFEIAERPFDPYYTGPLLAPGASIPKPGHYAVQPFLFVSNTFGVYDDRGRSHSIPHIHSVNGNLLAFAGLTKWLGLQFSGGYIYNRQSGNSGRGVTDIALTLLFPLLIETPHRPAILFAIRETFPTGEYQRLDPHKGGVDAIGSGAYQTSLWLNFAKLIWFYSAHPMRFRLSNQYTLPAHVRVNGFNSFGGGFGTQGTVKLPHAFRVDFGYEFSFTQKWVGAFDLVYIYGGEIRFSGHSGTNFACYPATVVAPASQQFSLAPAIQYNVNDSFGFIAGPWFTVWGRNSAQFVSGVFSFYVKW